MSSYPVRVDATLESPVSRWLWLVKWILLIPHYIVLVVLWFISVLATIVAFFAILFTGRYPRPIFDYNLGVMRWYWRVSFYGYAALGTDRYPPFSLGEHPEYPATLYVDYPERMSHWLVLVKTWLLAIPHYLVIAFFVGSGVNWFGPYDRTYLGGGLISITILITAISLLFTGRYLPGLFDFLLGMSRWIIRITAYSLLMTDTYPPFRFDAGGTDPGVPSPPPDVPGQQRATGEAPSRPSETTY